MEDLNAQLPLILRHNLVGVYLYGSASNSAFKSKRSDVDCIVVTRRELSQNQFHKLDAWLMEMAASNPWTRRLQMSMLLKDYVLTMNSKACFYQFGVLKRSSSDGNPIIWLDYQRRGKVLFGPPAESFLPPITPEILREALRRELSYLREEFEKPQSEWRDVSMYRAYAVLTVCRILYSFSNGTIASKTMAARWAIKKLPRQWCEIIAQAIDYHENGAASEIPLKKIKQFIRSAEAKID